jgi:hypothetical protein
METVWWHLKKLNIGIPYDPTIYTGHIDRRKVISISKRLPAFHIYCSTVHESQDTECLKVSFNM